MLVNLQEWAPVNEAREFGQKLNQIYNILTADCEDDWVVAAELAAPALGSAIKMLLTPSAGEILENYLEPGGGGGKGRIGRTQRNGRRRDRNGRYHGFWRNLIPDVDAMIASWLPGRNMFASRTPGFAQKMFWSGINVSDRVLWYLMLAELADDFTMNWCSNLMQARFCGNPSVVPITWQDASGNKFNNNAWNGDRPTNITNLGEWQFAGGRYVSVPKGKSFTGEFAWNAEGICGSLGNPPLWRLQSKIIVTHSDHSQTVYLGPAIQPTNGAKVIAQINGGVGGAIRFELFMDAVVEGNPPYPLVGWHGSGYFLGDMHDIPV